MKMDQANAAVLNDSEPRLIESCIACGGRSFLRRYRRLPWLCECRGCGLGFINPQPDDTELVSIYDSQYYETFGHFADEGRTYHELKRAWADRLLRQVERRVVPGRLLDVGSALGDLLNIASRRGWTAVGVEPNAFAVAYSSRIAPEAVMVSSVREAWSDHSPFDLITCNDVLEHLRRPDEELKRFHDCLRSGGWLIATTIDRNSLLAKLSRHRWVHYHRDHLWYFNRRSLIQLTAAAGFQSVRCHVAWKLYHLDYLLNVLGHSESFPLMAGFAERALQLLPKTARRCKFVCREGLVLSAQRI